MMKIKALLLVPILALVLTGCTFFEKAEQPIVSQYILLDKETTLGQTFVARYDGLQRIGVHLSPTEADQGTLYLHLRTDPQASADLGVGAIRLKDLPSPGTYWFELPPQEDSFRKDYFLKLRLEGPGSIQVGIGPANSYINGALYQGQTPQDAQLAFWLAYNPQQALAGLFQEGLVWLVLLGAGLFLFIIPGWGLVSAAWPGWSGLHWAEKLGLGGGISLAIYPLIFLWTDLVHLHLGPLYAWLPPLAGLGIVLWRNRSHLAHMPARLRLGEFKPATLFSADWLPNLVALIIIGLIFIPRFWAIRNLDLPMWGDSYQHTIIAQLLVDNAGLFDSWQPYSEIQSFTYHFGFHTLVTAFHWVSQLPLPQAALWTGQILNGLAVIFLALLAMRVHRSPWSVVFALLVGGLLSPMPMYYTNWGRYTQLASLAILPAAIYLAWAVLEKQPTDRRLIGLSWIAWGGLALTHYRILVFAVLFIPAYAIILGRQAGWRQLVSRVFWIGIGAGLLFLPWFLHVFAGKVMHILQYQITTPPSQVTPGSQQANSVGDIFFYLHPLIWLSLPVVTGWGLWRRNLWIALTSLWWFLILLAANPAWLGLPGTTSLTNFTVFIAAYFPTSIILGGAAGWLADRALSPSQAADRSGLPARSLLSTGLLIVLVLLVLGGGAWGARQRLGDINPPAHALATRPDILAANWLNKNTPADAYILVNSFPAFEDTVIAGSDGGWWLSLLAGRQTTQPPMNYNIEQGPRPDYVKWINQLTHEIQAKGITHPDVLAMLQDRGVTHLYIGQQQGAVNSPGPLLDSAQLSSSSHFKPVYHRDRVWVFELIP